MNILFLRGSVPPKNEHPEKLYYDSIENCEDMWTQLFYFINKKMESNGRILYVNGDREFVVDDNFKEQWIPSFKNFSHDFVPFSPDLIFCRGGFSYYDNVVKKFPKAKKIYYGAGVRSFPNSSFKDYDVFIVDSKRQKNIIEKDKHKRAELFIKPAAMLFKPVETKKKYDICFMANATQGEIKRHEMLIKAFSKSKYRILSLGNTNKKYVRMARELKTNIEWGGWSLRKELPQKISQCKVGICCSTNYDSCPRVIPEYLACGIPVIATKNINFWQNKYINVNTGMLVKGTSDHLKQALDNNIHSLSRINTRDYYEKHLSLDQASDHLINIIESIL
jgi:glycosyltransferase involved in cell wall biosynthesis